MSRLTQFFLTASAFAPIFLSYSLVLALDNHCTMSLLSLGVCVALVLTCVGLLGMSRKFLPVKTFKTKRAEPKDNEIFSFLLIYLLPLVTRDLATYNWWAWGLVAALFCLMVAMSYGFHFNPLLALFGYHFYSISEEGGMPHVLITKRRIYRTGEVLQTRQIADFALIETDQRCSE